MTNLGVAIVTNYRCPELLEEILRAWDRRGVAVNLIANVGPATFGEDVTRSLRGMDLPYVLVGGDDLLPVGHWPEEWPGQSGTIQAIRTLDVEGRRWFDWAEWADGRGLLGLQSYDHSETPATYISGNSQVWSREARAVAGWRGGFGDDCPDVVACRDAQKAGIRLLAPRRGGPTVIHLERRYQKGIRG